MGSISSSDENVVSSEQYRFFERCDNFCLGRSTNCLIVRKGPEEHIQVNTAPWKTVDQGNIQASTTYSKYRRYEDAKEVQH